MSSSAASHRRATSKNSINSALSHAPKLPPPRPSSRSGTTSPTRKPLHERSHSQTNQPHSSTIRLVQDPDTDVYSKYPVPSEPSQILVPPRNAPGYGFERPGFRVSNGSKVANTIAKFEASGARTPQPILTRKKALRHSTSTNTSEADTLVNSSFSPSSLRFSQGSTPPSSPPPESNDVDKQLEALSEEAPASYQRPTIRAVPPSSSGGDSLESRTRTLTPKTSDPSLTPPIPSTEQGDDEDQDQDPISDSENSQSSSSGHERAPSVGYEHNTDTRESALKAQSSCGSLALSDISYASIEPTYLHQPAQPSPVLHEVHTVTFASGTRINYPIVRAPTASSLRTDPQNAPYYISRMQDPSPIHQSSSQLSTIQSVSERDSRSIVQHSQSLAPRSQSEESLDGHTRASLTRQRGYTIESMQSSTDNLSSVEGNTAFSAVPQPLFSPVSRASSDEKDDICEKLDTVSPLPISVPLRMKNSGYLKRSNSDTAATNESRPGSSSSDISSFIHNNIPNWAKAYYQRGERISIMFAPESESSGSIRLGTSHSVRSNTPSEGNFSIGIHRPRNRPRNHNSNTESMLISDANRNMDGDNYEQGFNMHSMSDYATPHLRTDRRGDSRYGMWKAPSLDHDLHTTLFSRQNRQLFLFCLGFIMPLGWIIAAFLPLPPDPAVTPTPSQTDAEQQYTQQFESVDDKAFQKATWWRNLNRIMAVIGTLLIVAIIVLAVLV